MFQKVRIPLLRSGKPLLAVFVVAVVLLSTFAVVLHKPRTALAATTSNSINFQARLMSATGGIVPDGFYNVEFKIYNASTSGTLQFTDTYYDSNGVAAGQDARVRVANGYLTVSLGSQAGNPFPSTIKWDQQMWITMNVGGTTQTATPTWDGEMSPRLQLTAVPYAFRAGQLASLSGTNTAVLQFAGTINQDSTITLPDPGVTGLATVCYQTSTSCGFVAGAATNFIQNGTSAQANANFNIRSNAVGSVGAVVQGAIGQTADLLQLQTWDGTTNTNLFAVTKDGVVKLVGGQTADITTVSGNLTVAPGGSNTTLTLNSNGTGNLNVGTNAANKTINLGAVGSTAGSTTLHIADSSDTGSTQLITIGSNGNAADQVNITAGTTGGINVGSTGSVAAGSTIHIADTTSNTNAQAVTIGSTATNASNLTIIQGGSSATVGSEAIRLLPNTAGSIAIGSTSGTGTLTFGQSTATNTINIGNANFGAANTQTINIANGSQTTAASTLSVNILSGLAGNSGTASLKLANNDRVTQVDIGNVIADANRTLNVFTGDTLTGTTDTVNIATGNAVGSKVVHIADGSPTGTNSVTIGSINTVNNTTTIQGGNSTGAVSIQAAASGTITLGTANANTINLGNTTAATTVSIQGGTTASGNGAVSIQAGTAGVITIGTVNNSPITLGGTTGTTTLQGTVKLSTFAASTAAVAVCRDSSTTAFVSCGTGTGTGTPFIQGGNAFGASGPASLGTTDANNLQIITGSSSTVRATFDQSNNLYLGNGVTAAAPANFTVSGTGSSAPTVTGGNLTVQGGVGNTTGAGGTVKIQGGGSGNGAAALGGDVTIQGGTANGTGVSNGGNVNIQGGTLAASGTKGLIQLNGSTYFTSGTFSSGAASATITQSLVDSNSSIMAVATAAGSTFTLPSPTIQNTAGRVLYLTNNGATNAFILTFGTTSFSLNPGSTATLLWQWNGTTGSWTSAGVDASTLQNVYNNSTGGTTPEILLDSSPHKGVDIQDANTSIGSTESLLAVRASATATTLGASLFVVNASGKVAINLGSTSTTTTISNDLSFGQIAGATTARTIGVETQTSPNIGGNGLSLTAGTANGTGPGGQLSLQGGGTGTGAAAVGGAVLIQGGTSSGASGASNGGLVTIQGGTAGTGGTKGLIQLNGSTYFTSGTFSSGASSATITQSLVDSNSSIMVTATAAGSTFTLPSPTIQNTAGRVLYVTNNGATNSFILSFGTTSFSLNPGSTATLLWQWNGTTGSWTSAGVDASTLQNGYNNSSNSSTTPEILLDSSHAGLDIQDTVSGLTATVPLLAVRAGASGALGSPLFVVENSSGAARVGIGTATASRALDIAVNNTTVNALPLLIEQSGTGDSGVEFKSASKNFFAGIDNTDGQFKISSALAANGTQTQGDNNIETLPGDTNANGTQAYKVVASVTGTVSSMSVYLNDVGTSPNIQMGIYADSGNATPTPGTLLGTSTITGGVVGWNTLSIPGVSITSGTTYWLAFSENGFSHFARTVGGGGVVAYDIGAGVGYPVPTTWNSSIGNSTDKPSFYITVVSTSVTDDFNGTPLFRLSETGQAIFQNAANSTTAFQLQNAANTTLLGLDTSNAALNLGVTGTTATASTVNVGTSTGATQTINIGSATANSAANGTTVLIQGGTSSTAVQIQALATGIINVGTANAANTIQIGATGTTLSTGTQVINIGNSGGGGTTNVVVGSTSSAAAGSTTVQAKGIVTITAGAASTWSTTAGNLTIQAGAGSGALGLNGGAATGATTAGTVAIQGGAASATAGSNGGAVTITSGSGSTFGTGGTGATILLNAGSAGGSGNNAGGMIIAELGASTGTGTQGTFQVQNALGASLLTVDPTNTAAGQNIISNGGAETGAPPTGWTLIGSATVAAGTGTDLISGAQSGKVTTTAANGGVKITFGTAPTNGLTYIVSYSVKASSTMTTSLQTIYSPDNGTTLTTTCGSSQSLTANVVTKVSCTFTATTPTTAVLVIRQTDGTGRTIDIDNVSVVLQNSSSTQNVANLRVGGSSSQGLTLFTLDTYAAQPFSGSISSLAGSMYFDTTQGKIQCYDGTNWGACGAAPNSIITLSPEFAGAVLHGTVATAGATDNNIGNLTSDFCSDFLDINDATHGTSICGTNETFNFYRWTSPQANPQTYDIYITYQLPSTFKNFISGQTNMLGRTDSANSTVAYTVYKNVTGTGLSVCSASKTISTGVQASWQTATPTTDLSGCSFAAGNSLIVKVEVTSSSNANAYVGTLNFQYSNQ